MGEEEISSGSVSDQLPTLSANYSWLVCQNLEAGQDTGVQNLFTVPDGQLLHYCCQIPQLLGRLIRGCYHGWMILSDHPHNVVWSLWNPVTSQIIRLPRLILKDGDFDCIEYCCLSSSPDNPSSVLLLTVKEKPNFVFCRLDRKRKKSRWIEMSYAKQLKRVTDEDCILDFLTCSNGKVYAMAFAPGFILQVDIVVNGRDVVISLSPFLESPFPFDDTCLHWPSFHALKGSSTELFYIIGGFDEGAKDTLAFIYLFKLDMTSTTPTWEEIEDLKDAVLFLDLTSKNWMVYYNNLIASSLGGYLHILDGYEGNGSVIYSYHVEDKTVSVSPMPCGEETSHVSMWECRLEGNHGEAKCTIDYKQEEKDGKIVIRSVTNDEVGSNNITNESHLLSMPFHVLEMIMEFCVGFEYLNLRAICKRCCQLAGHFISLRNEASLRKLQTYVLDSPWLMVIEENRGIMNFTDPRSGNKYFMKTLPVSIHKNKLICSGYGWLLFYCNLGYLVFLNPFTSDVRNLPATHHLLESFCFSGPPTSPGCFVVGFSTDDEGHLYVHSLDDQGFQWIRIRFVLHPGAPAPYAIRSLTLRNLRNYALSNEGQLFSMTRTIEPESIFWWLVAEAPKCNWRYSKQYFLVLRDQHLLLVIVGDYGDFVEVFELNDSTSEWKKIDGLGRHVIYIYGATCLCIEAKTQEMQNKIFFPRLHYENEKIVFYSLETCRYHTFNGKDFEETDGYFFKTKHHLHPHAWIEPSWCKLASW